VILHYLAIDTVAAVIVWMLLASRLMGAEADPLTLTLVGAGIWLVYTADRWLDSFPGSTETVQAARHQFMGLHRKGMAILWLAGWVGFTVPGLILLDGESLLFGAIAVALGVFYLIYIQLHPSKNESGRFRAGGGLLVGSLVATAVCLFPILNGEARDHEKFLTLLLIASIFCLQTHSTRLWEDGQRISWRWVVILSLAGAIAAGISGQLPLGLAMIALCAGVLVVDCLTTRDRVAYADWMLAVAGAGGWVAAFVNLAR